MCFRGASMGVNIETHRAIIGIFMIKFSNERTMGVCQIWFM
jgi:hypothetical protein